MKLLPIVLLALYAQNTFAVNTVVKTGRGAITVDSGDGKPMFINPIMGITTGGAFVPVKVDSDGAIATSGGGGGDASAAHQLTGIARLDSILANQTNSTQKCTMLDDTGSAFTGAALGAGNNPILAVLRNPDDGQNMGGPGAPVHVQISGGTGDTLTLGTSALFATLSDGGSETVSGMDTVGSASGILVTIHADNPGVLVIRWSDVNDTERLVKEYQIPGRSGPNTLSDAIRSDIRGVKFKIEFYDTLDGLANNVDAQAYLSSKSLTPSDRPKALGRVDTMDGGSYRNLTGDPIDDTTPQEVVESLAGDVYEIRSTNNTVRYIGVYVGLVGEEQEVAVLEPTFQGTKEVTGLVKGARVSLKAIEGIYSTGLVNSGDMSLEFYGH